MNEIFQLNKEFMSSDEIAILTGKQKGHVCRDIENIQSRLGCSDLENLDYQIVKEEYDYNNRTCTRYYLNKKACLLLASGYDIILRAKIIDRWEELEKAARQDVPSYTIDNRIERAKAWIKEEEERVRLLAENIENKPKAEYYDELVDAGHLSTLRDTAKELGARPLLFNQLLEHRGYIYHDKHKNIKPISKYNGKYFEVKDVINNATGFSTVQTYVTVEGKNHFRELINKIHNNG